MNPALIFLAGLLVLPAGFGLTALVLRLITWCLGKVRINNHKNGEVVDTWAISHVASRLGASRTRILSIKCTGWALYCVFPIKRSGQQEIREIEYAVVQAARQSLDEAGYPTKTKDY